MDDKITPTKSGVLLHSTDEDFIQVLLKLYDDATYKYWDTRVCQIIVEHISKSKKSETDALELLLTKFASSSATKANSKYALQASLLGFCHQYGIGTQCMSKKTFEYYNIGAELGDGFALTQVGMCFRISCGTPYNYEKLIEFYEKAAKAGHPQGMVKYAEYQHGKIYAFWTLKAAEKGFPSAMCRAADFYRTGKYVNKDLHQALRFICPDESYMLRQIFQFY
ncbi:1825_t:CDS:1 [Ambispora leptoticha]|uniref:1825_t:CDS:1 n=1 Tax=Ambispora leptoticha TaxID=144679 RepID=A0A9N9DJM6_9GLOM|nr:1825_t:CDS:1 [Ambispora leptoticha]